MNLPANAGILDFTHILPVTTMFGSIGHIPPVMLADIVAFLEEIPLAFILGFVAIGLVLISKYLLPK